MEINQRFDRVSRTDPALSDRYFVYNVNNVLIHTDLIRRSSEVKILIVFALNVATVVDCRLKFSRPVINPGRRQANKIHNV